MIPFPGRRPQTGISPPSLPTQFPMELSRNLREDTVAHLRPRPPRFLDASEPVSVAVELMRREKVGCLLVTQNDRLEGIFTEKDLLTRVLARGRSLDTPMAACMTPKPTVISPKDCVRTAIRRMESGGYRRLPVVDDAGRPVGILSVKQVVHYLAEHFPALVYNQPPLANQYPDMAEGA